MASTPAGDRWIWRLVVLTSLVVSAGMFASATSAGAAPSNPSDAQITRAGQQSQQRAVEVGRLAARLATSTGEMHRLADTAEMAVEQYDKARADLGRATARVASTRAAARRAHQRVDRARADLREFARGSYIQGSMLGSVAALVGPGGADDLIARMAYLDVASRRRLDVIGALVRAEVRSANADSAGRAALADQQDALVAAGRARSLAEHRLVRSRAQIAQLGRQVSVTRNQLSRAQHALDSMLSDRRRYLAWRHHQQVVAAQQAAAHQAAAALAGSDPGAGHHASLGGSGWSPARGRAVAQAVLRWLGTPYAWSGGNAEGPTEGLYPDEGVRGFDCSGLALWAWAQVGVRLPHYSGYQYRSGAHVARDALMPGDLVFWSFDGTPTGIHHVAIYIGHGRVVQAPQSGDVVRVSPMWSAGYMGATRPGT
ncbi:MAG TPA: NlpC/P60 family protein [Mycobacteriales bacterium]